MHLNRRIASLITAAAAAAGLGLANLAAAAPAAAAAINGPYFTSVTPGPAEAGYEIHSTVRFNDERATFCLAPGSTSSVGLGLQENVNGGETAGLALINDGTGYTLESGVAKVPSQPTGTPLISSFADFTPVATVGTPAGDYLFSVAAGGCAFLELRQSTAHSRINLIEGNGPGGENDSAVLGTVFAGIRTTFHAPFIGLLRSSTTLPVATRQVSITRNGVTEPSGENVKTIGGARVTFDAFAMDETEATVSGGPPTVTPANPLALINSPALPGVGSAFGITTP
jgi:hypothetical protein